MREYVATYLVKDYTLADAFRPNPAWGMTRLRTNADALAAHTDGDILKAAVDKTPNGYRLANLVEKADGIEERFIFREPASRLLSHHAAQAPN